MKNLLIIVFSFFIITDLFAQTQGMNYQAVIIDQNAQEIAGKDISGNILPNRSIKVRFTILDAAGTIDYQEEHETITDSFGMINLTIGQGIQTASSLKTFKEIDWDGSNKNLKVDLSISQSDVFYTDFSYQELTFIPYAYHKNISATGALKVDGKSNLQDLTVEATTNLNGSLDVNNDSPTHLSGVLTVEENTTLSDTLTVNSLSNLNGKVIITADVNGSDGTTESYPLYVNGSNQGIAIKVDNNRNNKTNFVTFWDDEGAQGRIEGESTDDIYSDPLYYFENAKLAVEAGVAAANLAAAFSASTVCAGLGACVTAPPPSKIAFGVAQVVVRAAQIAAYNYYRIENAGVVYKSKGADYAEYLPKANPEEKLLPGDIVGLRGDKVSRSTQNADKVMIVSAKPIVLGNMPKEGMEDAYEKIAFIGQVEARVFGKVNVGDYIIPSGKNDGTGIAVSPDRITAQKFLSVAGIAWNNSISDDYGYVNVAVGLHTSDAAKLIIRQERKISEQEIEITNLKNQLNQMNTVLAKLLPEYASLMNYTSYSDIAATNQGSDTINQEPAVADNKQNANPVDNSIDSPLKEDLTIVYFEINREHIVEGIKMARQLLLQQESIHNAPAVEESQQTQKSSKTSVTTKRKLQDPGNDISKYTLFTKLDSDTEFREAFIDEMLTLVKKKSEDCYNNDLQSGVKVLKYK